MIEYWVIEENLGGDNWKTVRHVLDLEAAVRQVAGMKAYQNKPSWIDTRRRSEGLPLRIRNTKTNEVIDDAIII